MKIRTLKNLLHYLCTNDNFIDFTFNLNTYKKLELLIKNKLDNYILFLHTYYREIHFFVYNNSDELQKYLNLYNYNNTNNYIIGYKINKQDKILVKFKYVDDTYVPLDINNKYRIYLNYKNL